MKEKTKKILTNSLSVLAVLCCLLAIIMLFIPSKIKLETDLYARPPGEMESKIESEESYLRKNFFEFIDYLNSTGWSNSEEIALVVLLFVSLLVSVVFLLAQSLPKMREYIRSRKKWKYFLFVLSAVTLGTLIFSIILLNDLDSWRQYDFEIIPLGYPYSGWDVYTRSLFLAEMPLDLVCGSVMVAFLAECLISILNFKYDCEKNGQQRDSVEAVTIVGVAQESNTPANMFAEKNPFEELIKYKALLDAGVITAEDFEEKKKELLNFHSP